MKCKKEKGLFSWCKFAAFLLYLQIMNTKCLSTGFLLEIYSATKVLVTRTFFDKFYQVYPQTKKTLPQYDKQSPKRNFHLTF